MFLLEAFRLFPPSRRTIAPTGVHAVAALWVQHGPRAASYSLIRPVDGMQQVPAGGWRMRRDLQAVAARVAELLGAAWSKCPLGSAPAWLSCASSGRAWRLWAARHSQEEAAPMGAPPLPRVLVLADFGGRLASMARGLLLPRPSCRRRAAGACGRLADEARFAGGGCARGRAPRRSSMVKVPPW